MEKQKPRALRRELEASEEVYRQGNPIGLLQAIDLCRVARIVPPEWVLLEAGGTIYALLHGLVKQTRRGWLNTWRKRHDMDMLHFARWEDVKTWRERGLPWKRVFEFAARGAEHKEWHGSAEDMEKSYKKVQKAMRSGKAAQYFIPSSNVLPHPEFRGQRMTPELLKHQDTIMNDVAQILRKSTPNKG